MSNGGTTTGYIENARPHGQLHINCTFRCSCGAYRSGGHTVTKGTTQTWNCGKCKKKVIVQVPK